MLSKQWEVMGEYEIVSSPTFIELPMNDIIKTIYISMELFPRGYRLLIKGEATSVINQSEFSYVEERVNIYTPTASRQQSKHGQHRDRTYLVWSFNNRRTVVKKGISIFPNS